MNRKIILLAFMFSGMAALIYEIVWIRPLQYIFGSTIYTISIIFAAFLAGLGLGALLISRYVDRIENLPSAYAFMELGIGLYGVLLLIIFNLLPSLYRFIFPLNESFLIFESLKLLISFFVLLVPTTLMGATFPIIARFYTKEKIGKGIGEVYSANNIGAIIGSFAAGFLLVPVLGIKSTILFAAFINILVASLILFFTSKQIAKKVIPIAFVVFMVIIFIGNYDIEKLYVSGFDRSAFPEEEVQKTEILFYKEGLHATINVVDEKGYIALLINGYGQGSTSFSDMRVNLLLVYLPLLIKPEAETGLVIGLGTGTTAGHFSQFVKTTTVEIEPTVVETSEYFSSVNLDVLENQYHTLVLGDARNYLLSSKEKYDIIVSEPTNTWQSFSTPLFSKEFYELVKKNLNENGLYVQWVPIYDFTPEDFRSFYRTFSSEFPYVVAFKSFGEEETGFLATEIIFVGSTKPIDHTNIEKNFELVPQFARDSLDTIFIASSQDMLNLMLFTNEQMEGYGSDAPLVTDDNALLEFSTASHIFSVYLSDVLEDINTFFGVRNVR